MNAFWVLCVTLSLAVFFLGTLAGSAVSNALAWAIWRLCRKKEFLRFPGLLFCIRMFPVVLGMALTLGFALPSFLLLEPKRTAEAPELYLIVLALAGFCILIVFLLRSLWLLSVSRKTLKKWLLRSEILPISFPIPVYRVESPESLIAVVGILRPKVLVGKAAFNSLTPHELKAALSHELEHVRSLDNQKQFVLKVSRLPRFLLCFSRLDPAWSA